MSFIHPSEGIVPSGGILRKLYENARERDVEYASSAFWQAYLQTHFYPGINYAVVCEYAPGEKPRSRIDIMVLQYHSNHHSVMRLILVEAKRPGGSVNEVEDQAYRGVRTVMRDERLSGLFAITTIGTAYRTWSAEHRSTELIPLHGQSPLGDRGAYIEADTADARSLEADILFIKGEQAPLRVALTVPSQTYLLHQSVSSLSGHATTSQQSAAASIMPAYTHTTIPDIVELDSPGEGMDLDVPTGPSTSGASELKQAADQLSDQTMGEQPSSQIEDQGSVGGDGSKWIEVTLHRQPHMMRKDEILFTNVKSKLKFTRQEEWQKTKHNGRTIYVYQGRHNVYWSATFP